MKIVSASPGQTRRAGKSMARKILGGPAKKQAVILALTGNLGGGKTTFLQGFAQGLGVKQKVTSPTFVILKRFKVDSPASSRFKSFYHLDCYRLKKGKELLDLSLKEIISNPENIVAVEWADRVSSVLPEIVLRINFVFLDENRREIIINEL